MTEASERRIVIVGGGTAGWMTAAAMARFLIPGSSVSLIESDEIGTVGVGEATIPAIRNFNSALGLDEAEFVAATGGTYKLGIAFENWNAPGEGYVHAFGLVGRALGLLPFHHYWLRGRSLGMANSFGHYVLNTVALAANRFAHVDRQPNSALPPMPYAFHFDAGLYARFLRGFAEERGVVRTEGRIVGAERNEKGDITHVILADGTKIEGDLFVDCSGFRALLIEGELQSGFEDWSHWLPCDRAMPVPCESVSPVTPYTRATAHKAGWQWRIPLQHRIGNGYVFCSRYLSDDEAAETLLGNLDGKPTADPRVLKFTTGMRRNSWVRNVIAVGLSAGFIEPLESTSIHVVQTAVNRILDLLPSGEIDQATRDEYNRRTRFEMERIRDFVVLHYHSNGRVGDPFWDEVRAMTVPDSLRQKIDLFRSTGRVFREGDELFDIPGWVQVMIGHGIVPETWHPIADQLSEETLGEFLRLTEAGYAADVARMPDHGAYVASFAPMNQPMRAAF